MLQFYIFLLCLISLKTVNGKYISLQNDDWQIPPKEVKGVKSQNQSTLMEDWARDLRVREDPFAPKGKQKFLLGSKKSVEYDNDIGFLSTLLHAYNNHMVVRTTPEDWWITITQKIAIDIDKNANDPKVRKFFVQHEGKKTLEVLINNINDIGSARFFEEMKSQISQNINNPTYTSVMDCRFSTSSDVHNIVNNIMLMYSFKEYFNYQAGILCGIPGVIMEGTEEDWKSLVTKLGELERFLQPILPVLGLYEWFGSSQQVLNKLVDTYQDNPDYLWWRQIMTPMSVHGGGCGSPGTRSLGGWFVKDFLGLQTTIPWSAGVSRRDWDKRDCGADWCRDLSTCQAADLEDISSGLNVVPLTIKDHTTGHEEETNLVAGVTGYKVDKDVHYDPKSKETYSVAQAVHGWGLLVNPESRYLQDNQQKTRGPNNSQAGFGSQQVAGQNYQDSRKFNTGRNTQPDGFWL